MARKTRKRIQEATAYFRATEEVSKPIAFLMLFFGLAFIASLMVGVFLLGRWSYKKIVNVDQPVVVTTPDTTQKPTVTVVPSGSSANQTTATVEPSITTTAHSGTLPNTGQPPNVYFAVLLLGFFVHQIYLRLKFKE